MHEWKDRLGIAWKATPDGMWTRAAGEAQWMMFDSHVAAAAEVVRLAARVRDMEEGERLRQIEMLEEVNAAAEAGMLAGRPITGAHHRAIESKLAELRALK